MSESSASTLSPVSISIVGVEAACSDSAPFERESDTTLIYTNVKSASSPWRRAPFISIAVAGAPVAVEPIRLPLPFLEDSGDNAWPFVAFLLEQTIEGKGAGIIVNDATGAQVNLSDAPDEGCYTYHPRDGRSWSRGPQGSRVFRAPIDGEGWEDRSSIASADSSTSGNFRDRVARRDQFCVVTGQFEIQAAHLVPKNRTDLYRQLLGKDWGGDPYAPECGIALKADVRVEYDRFRCSFYHKDSKIFFHCFTAMHQYHGIEITKRWSHFTKEYLEMLPLPDERLMAWHYAQCCMARIRGFSAGMTVNRR